MHSFQIRLHNTLVRDFVVNALLEFTGRLQLLLVCHFCNDDIMFPVVFNDAQCTHCSLARPAEIATLLALVNLAHNTG